MDLKLNSQNILSQEVLRELESLCIQEEPPACTAACPLHLDVRGLCRLVEKGDFAGAFSLYQKAIPFAQLVAHTCDAPCEGPCLRAGLGGAIRVPGLERAAAKAAGKPAKPPLLLPKKDASVAVVGGGLRGMAAANDLARKGYKVTLFEKGTGFGGWLRELPEATLPADVLHGEIDALLALPVIAQLAREVPVDSPGQATELLAERGGKFDAVFVACASPLDERADGDTLLVEGYPGLVAGRRGGRRTQGNSSVYDVFDGRSAALSVDRLLQKVSVDAGREKEGSADTALYTNLAGIEAVPAVDPGPRGYSEEEARAEAARCIQCECMECVKKCGFLQHYGRYPRKYVREVYNNLSIAMGNHDANNMINRCALCGQCGAVCPNGLDMGQVFLAARRRMTETGKMPQSAFEFALLDMDYSMGGAFSLAKGPPGGGNAPAGSTPGPAKTQRVSERGRPTGTGQAPGQVLFPGCQLAASEPELVEAVYKDLLEADEGMGLWLSCCGVMARWAGDEARFAAAREKLRADWEALGRPRVVAACPTCAKTLTELHGIPAEHIAGVLSRADIDSGADYTTRSSERATSQKSAESSAKTGTVFGRDCHESNGSIMVKAVLHDACGARFNREMQEGVRGLAAACGVDLVAGCTNNAGEEAHCASSASVDTHDISRDETTCGGNTSPCCGYGGLVPFVDSGVAGEITDVALAQLEEDKSGVADAGGKDTSEDQPLILTYCVNCRDRYLARGREAVHILELCYPEVPLRRRMPTWSERQENRAALKLRLLAEIWNEGGEAMPKMELIIPPALEAKIEETHILHSDMAAAIRAAEESGDKLLDPASGHFTARHRPGNVTFWVEYTPEDARYRVHNAWCHRMTATITARMGGAGG